MAPHLWNRVFATKFYSHTYADLLNPETLDVSH